MEKQRKASFYASRVTLKVRGVPYDMLRYDNLVPATESESHKLERVAGDVGAPGGEVIVFRRFAAARSGPTYARYRGHGAEVLSVEDGDKVSAYKSIVTLKLLSVPYDMMRYDNLVPATEEDSRKLDRVDDHTASPADRVVKFRRFAMKPGAPTLDRYRGFGAEVESWEPFE